MARVPGGEMAAQMCLIILAGVVSGVRFEGMKSPKREAVITLAMSGGGLILPAFGMGNNFWLMGVSVAVCISSIAVIFVTSRR